MTQRLSLRNDFYPLLKLAIPLALAGMVQSSVFFFETLFLARVGTDILAAGALVNWLFATLVVILLGTLSSINILISRKYGANDHNGISLVVRDGLFLAILLTIPAFLLVWNASTIFLLFGQSPAIVLLAKAYLHALAWGILPNFLMIAILDFIMGLGHTRIIVIFNVLSVSINIFFSFSLIFGKFGMPALGIAGAGWGATISYWVAVVILAAYVLTHKNYKNYFHQILNFRKPSFLVELLQVGVPMGAMYCVEVAFFLILALVMGSLGSNLLAANQVVLQYLGTLMGVIFSIAQAITVRMGHLLGAKEPNSAKHAGYAGIFISATFMGIVSIFYWFFPLMLISVDFDIYNPNNLEIIRDITILFAIAGLFQILEAMRISLFAALRALKDTSFTLLASIISFWCIALPIGYLLATYFNLRGPGLWYGMVLGATFSVLLLCWRFKSKIRLYAA